MNVWMFLMYLILLKVNDNFHKLYQTTVTEWPRRTDKKSNAKKQQKTVTTKVSNFNVSCFLFFIKTATYFLFELVNIKLTPLWVISARSTFQERFSTSASNWACWYSNCNTNKYTISKHGKATDRNTLK